MEWRGIGSEGLAKVENEMEGQVPENSEKRKEKERKRKKETRKEKEKENEKEKLNFL